MAFCKIPMSVLFFLALSIIILPSNAQNADQDYVNTHNAARTAVGVGGVTWNTTLAAYAQNYANAMANSGCNIVASNGPYGENIGKGGITFTGIAAVNLWVAEKPYYNHNTNLCDPTSKECRHFTQVVWSTSVRMGCFRAECKPIGSGNYYVVCSYDPPGNTLNGWPY